MSDEIIIRVREVLTELSFATRCQDCTGDLAIIVHDPVREPEVWDLVSMHDITCPTIPPTDRNKPASAWQAHAEAPDEPPN